VRRDPADGGVGDETLMNEQMYKMWPASGCEARRRVHERYKVGGRLGVPL
jgi:hypothetical protein